MKQCKGKGILVGSLIFIGGFFAGLLTGFIATCKDEDEYDEWDDDDVTEFDNVDDDDDEDTEGEDKD